jgi:hypothetical protein
LPIEKLVTAARIEQLEETHTSYRKKAAAIVPIDKAGTTDVEMGVNI